MLTGERWRQYLRGGRDAETAWSRRQHMARERESEGDTMHEELIPTTRAAT